MRTEPTSPIRPVLRWKLAAGLAVVMAVLIWSATQPPTTLEPVPWTGVLEF